MAENHRPRPLAMQGPISSEAAKERRRSDGNVYLPFADMIAIEKIDDLVYRSIAKPFAPGAAGRAYGGHVYAQACWAAAQTIPKGYTLHNVTGFFILGGLTDVPFVYSVQIIRNGKSYCTRIVNVTQAEGKGICFTCTCSFKAPEPNPFDVQEKIDIPTTYAAVLAGKSPTDWAEAPGIDASWYWKRFLATGKNEAFPGLESRKVEMGRFNAAREPFDRRALLYYRVLGALPPSADANMHACAHLYASDRNSLFVTANNLEVGDIFHQMASLSHTVIFHTPPEEFLMEDPAAGGAGDDRRRWFVKEDWTTRFAEGRGMHHSRMVGPDGRHVATSMQEGLIRLDGDEAAKVRARVAGEWRNLKVKL